MHRDQHLDNRARRSRATGGSRVGLVQMVRRANAPMPAEHSVAFRVATAVAVLTGILACAAVGEVSVTGAALASAGSFLRDGLLVQDARELLGSG